MNSHRQHALDRCPRGSPPIWSNARPTPFPSLFPSTYSTFLALRFMCVRISYCSGNEAGRLGMVCVGCKRPLPCVPDVAFFVCTLCGCGLCAACRSAQRRAATEPRGRAAGGRAAWRATSYDYARQVDGLPDRAPLDPAPARAVHSMSVPRTGCCRVWFVCSVGTR